MKHYVCKGDCGGVSDEKKKCSAEGCSLYGVELEECDCTDGNHHDKKDE